LAGHAGAGLLLGLVGAGVVTRGASAAPENILTVGTLLNIKTLDPGRELENATNVDHVTYDTLVTFYGEDIKTVRPSLATKWTASLPLGGSRTTAHTASSGVSEVGS